MDAIVFPDPTNDACILEFDVTPIGDTIKFNYVFGSDEYPEFINSFNDIFAFFISGPGVPFQNIALVPGTTTPVSISNVNNGMSNTGPCVNCTYYVNNGDGTTPGNNPTVQYDGFTTVLQAVIKVTPCQTYHLKMAVADVVDGIYDSGVFLEQASISSNVVTLSAGSSSPIVPFAIEGCMNGFIMFTKIKNFSSPLTLHFQIGGSATNGVDYSQIDDSIVIAAGDTSGVIPIFPIIDATPDDSEIVMIYLTEPCTGQIYDSASLIIRDQYQIDIMPDDTAICIGDTITLGAPDDSLLTFLWSPNQHIDCVTCSEVNIYPPPNFSGLYKVDIVLAGLCYIKDSMNVVVQSPFSDFNIQDLCIGNTNTFLDQSGTNSGAIVSWSWDFGDNNNDNVQSPNHTYSSIGAYNVKLSIVDDKGCVHDTTKTLNVYDQPSCSFNYSPGSNIYVGDNISFNDLSNAATQWIWSYGNGDFGSVQSPVYSYGTPGTFEISLISSNGYCHDTCYQNIEVKYEFFAEVPQVFTPNNDGQNDKLSFLVNGLFDMEFKIVNRWGQTVYLTNDPLDPGWDGNINHKEQPVGVYVYYLIGKKSSNMESVLLKGDVTLIR
ncbi:MAG TPA: PKD domain-containing protein [Bacteroidetes bacterium]|nr:PKD domain-containing protein [Bacteroidota bacterium]